MQDQENKEVLDQQPGEAPVADATEGANAQAAEQAAAAAPSAEPGLEEQLSATEAKLAEMHDADRKSVV